MKLLLAALVVNYLLMASFFLTRWLEFFEKDTSVTSNDRFLSEWILVLATILWPVAVPIAYLELLKAQKISNLIDESVIEYRSRASTRFVPIFVRSLLTISGLAAISYIFA